jgi:hypothetical protein
MNRPKIAALVGFALAATSAFAWDATGHMIIADIALRNMSAKAKAEANRILSLGAQSSYGVAPTDFVLVSTWADEIRNRHRETGPWHYEDHHFRTDGQPVTAHADPENAVWAIDRFTKILSDRSKSDSDRADALRFLIHFVGDIHQPLHATARDTAALPNGDRGGNDFHIVSPPGFPGLRYPLRNLHSLWDLGGGLFPSEPESPDSIDHEAAKIASEHPKRSIPHVADHNPEDWALESFEIAKKFVYSTPEGQTPTDAYLAKTREISAERVAAAGYRLADLLNRALG